MHCPSCTARLDHCHGTLVTHSDGYSECTDPRCPDLAQVRHTLVIDCEIVQGGCGCLMTAAPVEGLLRAS